ncbi:MAG: GFA family protein [Methyloceanibacter sp.]
MSQNVHTGGCACGEFRFEAREEPYRVDICHCLTCRKAHGAPFNFYLVFPSEAVIFGGEVPEFSSSEHGQRYFCAACGSPAYSPYSRAGRDLSLSRIV